MTTPLALVGASFLMFPVSAFAFEYDASITQGSISYSSEQVYAGEMLRVYGKIFNRGTKDIAGTIRFFQGPIGIGEPLPFSLKAGSAQEDLWTDWRPVEGTYNLVMSITATNPSDEDLSNNTVVTPMLTIIKRPPPPPPPPPPSQTTTQSSTSSGVTSTSSSAAKTTSAKKQPTTPSTSVPQKNLAVKKESAAPTRPRTAPLAVATSPTQKTNDSFYDLPVVGEAAAQQSEFKPVVESTDQSAPRSAVPQEKQSSPWGLAALLLLSVGTLGAGAYFWKAAQRREE